MSKYWKYIVGIASGLIIAIIALCCADEAFGGVSTFLGVVLCAIPIICCLLGALIAHRNYEIVELIVFPIISIIIDALIIFIAACIAEIIENPLHLFWIIPLIGVFIPPTTKGIIILLEK